MLDVVLNIYGPRQYLRLRNISVYRRCVAADEASRFRCYSTMTGGYYSYMILRRPTAYGTIRRSVIVITTVKRRRWAGTYCITESAEKEVTVSLVPAIVSRQEDSLQDRSVVSKDLARGHSRVAYRGEARGLA
jgi:hypothetical protein